MTETKPLSREPGELLACPMCGEAGKVYPQNGYIKTPNGWRQRIWCATCGLTTREFGTEAEAVAAWNTRAAPSSPPQSEVVEAANEETIALLRSEARATFGGNHTFADDDIRAFSAEIIRLRERLATGGGERELGDFTVSLKVTLHDGESDTQVDFQRDPKNWTQVRDAILIGIERLQGMIADQGGCPARPKRDASATPEPPADLEERARELLAAAALENGAVPEIAVAIRRNEWAPITLGSALAAIRTALSDPARIRVDDALKRFREHLYSAVRCQEQDCKVNGLNHPGLLEPMREILQRLLAEFDALSLIPKDPKHG